MGYGSMELSSALHARASPPAVLFEFRIYQNNFLLKDLDPDFTNVEKKNHSLPYFFDYKDSEERKLVYCHNMKKLLLLLGLSKYDRNERWLFINSSRHSLKCVVLHVINTYSSATIGHSTTIKKKYEEIKRLENRWNMSNTIGLFVWILKW